MKKQKETFKLIGLNKTDTGIYATVECGKEDWFHSEFDESAIPADRQYALFDYFKNSKENEWSEKNHKVVVEFERYSSGNVPINPTIKELNMDSK